LRSSGPGRLLTVALAIALGGGAAHAASLSGTAATTLYILEDGSGSDSGTRTLAYQRLGISVPGLGRGLSFRGSLVSRNDLSEGDPSLTKTRIHHAALRYRSADSGVRAALGRHYVHAGGGSGVIDGVSVRVRAGSRVNLLAYGGTLGHEERTELLLLSRDEGSRWGFWSAARVAGALRLSGGVETVRRDAETTERNLDTRADYRFGRVASAYAGHRYDMESEEAVETYFGGTVRPAPHHRVTLAYRDRARPEIVGGYFASLFADIEPAAFRRMSAAWRWSVDRDLSLSANWVSSIRSTDDERSDIARGTVSWKNWSVGYRATRGIAGDRNGLFGSVRRNLRPGLDVRATANLQSYERGTVVPVEDGAAAFALAADYHASDRLKWNTRLEYLNNDRHPYALRLLCGVTCNFGIPDDGKNGRAGR
jgi:hypothetical protein